MTARAYAEVIGDPIEHSLSPVIHCFWLKQLGIRASYRRRTVRRGELSSYLLKKRADSNWRGCNVTMPLKLDAIDLADEASDRAIATGAANLIVPRDGRLIAANTDVGAVMKLVGRLMGGGAPTGLITVLGSGGAARAALMALHLLGLSAVRIQSRNLGEAYKLAVQFGFSEEPRPFQAPVDGDGLINATPLGMAGDAPLESGIEGLAQNGWVFDFVTSSAPTPLIVSASERGLATVDGIEMLVEQAADSFARLFGQGSPRDRDARLFERLRA